MTEPCWHRLGWGLPESCGDGRGLQAPWGDPRALLGTRARTCCRDHPCPERRRDPGILCHKCQPPGTRDVTPRPAQSKHPSGSGSGSPKASGRASSSCLQMQSTPLHPRAEPAPTGPSGQQLPLHPGSRHHRESSRQGGQHSPQPRLQPAFKGSRMKEGEKKKINDATGSSPPARYSPVWEHLRCPALHPRLLVRAGCTGACHAGSAWILHPAQSEETGSLPC